MESNLQVFCGRSMDGDSTVMPQVLTWVDKVFEDMPGCSSDDSRAVILFLNLPACGVISATQWDFFLSFVANTLNRFRRNSIAIIMQPNRAGQKTKSRHGLVLSF